MDQPDSNRLPAPQAGHYMPPTPQPAQPPISPMDEIAEPQQQPAAAPAAPSQPAPKPTDYSQPVAYDAAGRPLYAHPPQAAAVTPAAASPEPATATASPAEAPAEPPASAQPATSSAGDNDQAAKHQESLIKYPDLNLSDGEYVIAAVRRDSIGMLEIWGAAILAFLVAVGFVGAFLYGQSVSNNTRLAAAVGLAVFGLIVVVGASIFSKIYQGNKLYLTNESVIQEIQSSLTARSEQTVNLANIQDVSYKRDGYLASLFDFGTIQLTTEGEDTNYRFTHVANPKQQAAIINNAVEDYDRTHQGND